MSGNNEPTYIFTNVDDDMMIDLYSGDAMTTHAPKQVFNSGRSNTKVNNAEKLSEIVVNEAAFYRRYRNASKIKNENLGGKRMPDFFIPGMGGPSEEDIEYMKKFDIPILEIHEIEREKKVENELESREAYE